MAEAAPVTPDSPLHPHQRYPEKQEADEIGDHEGAATVLSGLHGKAQEVAEADGVPGHGQNQADSCTPAFAGVSFERQTLSSHRFSNLCIAGPL